MNPGSAAGPETTVHTPPVLRSMRPPCVLGDADPYTQTAVLPPGTASTTGGTGGPVTRTAFTTPYEEPSPSLIERTEYVYETSGCTFASCKLVTFAPRLVTTVDAPPPRITS